MTKCMGKVEWNGISTMRLIKFKRLFIKAVFKMAKFMDKVSIYTPMVHSLVAFLSMANYREKDYVSLTGTDTRAASRIAKSQAMVRLLSKIMISIQAHGGRTNSMIMV